VNEILFRTAVYAAAAAVQCAKKTKHDLHLLQSSSRPQIVNDSVDNPSPATERKRERETERERERESHTNSFIPHNRLFQFFSLLR